MKPLRVGITSDTHIGITKPKAIQKMLRAASNQTVDVWVHAGDFCGGVDGARSVNTTLNMMRIAFGSKVPIIGVLGNHDFWQRGAKFHGYGDFAQYAKPSEDAFRKNLVKAAQAFKDTGAHFLDLDGPFIHEGVAFVGNTMWYTDPDPGTNDTKYLPWSIEGMDPHSYMLKRAFDLISNDFRVLKKLIDDTTPVVFVSHFPVVALRTPSDEKYGGPLSVGEAAIRLFGCPYFINGHAHQRHEGSLRYEAGSDYREPRYLIMEVQRCPKGNG